MIKKQVFAIFDSKAGYYMNPFMYRTRQEDIRGFSSLVADKQTAVGQFPADFTLFHIAEFDEDHGEYKNLENGPVNLGVGVEYLVKEVNKDIEVVE